ncbi:methionine ABC transporter ATP-binding protein [Asticcacaulis sp. AC466]|uniref:methionine ABC transporter ATP-binding protein n=1 Tax=Asticcacaulis sp. AC466 TaxID=1282362 RepID=UPI0004CE20F3|nr:ATP-binding cassette domain-containing protein [Asticcacaulis sp. AC466]
MIQLSDVAKRFALKGRSQDALAGVSLGIARGEIFGVIGPSGSGKSTLIRLINRLETPTRGTVEIDGADIGKLTQAQLSVLRHKLGMIFQSFGLLSSKTARQNVLFALQLAKKTITADDQRRVDDLLARVGLSEHADKYPAQLSGGQKQRVAIARALANAPDILLCDEATSALDPESTQGVLTLLAELNRDLGLTIVVVTHEMDVVRQICDRVAVLDAGRIAEVGSVAQVLFDPQSEAAKALGRHLLPHAPVVAGATETRLRLTYFGEVVTGDALSAATQGVNVRFSILAGQVSELKTGPYGHLIVDISGPDRERVIERLTASGVRVEALS